MAWVIYSVETGAIRLCTDGVAIPDAGEAALEVPAVVKPSAWRVDLATLSLVEVPAPQPDPLIALRRERDRLLFASDWTRLDDTRLTEAQREEARVYRDALRDAPAAGVLPTPPSWLF